MKDITVIDIEDTMNMDKEEKRPNRRLQRRRFRKMDSVSVKKQEKSREDSRHPNEANNMFTNDESCNSIVRSPNSNSKELDNREMRHVNSSERFKNDQNRGRKRLKSDDTNLKRKYHRKSLNDENEIVSRRHVDKTIRFSNGRNTNIDVKENTSFAMVDTGKSKDTAKLHHLKSSRRAVAQCSKKGFHSTSDPNTENYNESHQSDSYFSEKNENSSNKNSSTFYKNHSSKDKRTSNEISDSRIYSNEFRNESHHSVPFDDYKSNQERTKSRSSNMFERKDDYQRKKTLSCQRQAYERIQEAKNIVPKALTLLDIIEWHTMPQHNRKERKSGLYFEPNFLKEGECEKYYHFLKKSINWQEKEIIIAGKRYAQPRLLAWYGPLPYTFSYSALESNCQFPPLLLDLKERIEKLLKEEHINVTFNSVLLNMYRDGKDSVGWHSDDELFMGIDPTIASVSLGATRTFKIKRKQDQRDDGNYQQKSEEYAINLTSGSLLVMDGAMQQHWLHRVPKDLHVRDCRINLTFRTIYPR